MKQVKQDLKQNIIELDFGCLTSTIGLSVVTCFIYGLQYGIEYSLVYSFIAVLVNVVVFVVAFFWLGGNDENNQT